MKEKCNFCKMATPSGLCCAIDNPYRRKICDDARQKLVNTFKCKDASDTKGVRKHNDEM